MSLRRAVHCRDQCPAVSYLSPTARHALLPRLWFHHGFRRVITAARSTCHVPRRETDAGNSVRDFTKADGRPAGQNANSPDARASGLGGKTNWLPSSFGSFVSRFNAGLYRESELDLCSIATQIRFASDLETADQASHPSLELTMYDVDQFCVPLCGSAS